MAKIFKIRDSIYIPIAPIFYEKGDNTKYVLFDSFSGNLFPSIMYTEADIRERHADMVTVNPNIELEEFNNIQEIGR